MEGQNAVRFHQTDVHLCSEDELKCLDACGYDQQTHSVKICTSDVIEEQKENEEKRTQHTDVMKALEDALVNLELELSKNLKDMEKIKKKIKKNTKELRYLIRNNRSYRYSFFWGLFRSNRPYNDAAIVAKQAELATLLHEKNSLREQDWTIKIKRLDLQLTLANSKIQLGVIPSPIHLKEVQLCLDQIRQILVDLKNFWEKVDAMLELMIEKTFIGEELVDLEDMKKEFLESVEETKKCWQTFGTCCQRAQNIFSFQSKDAYKFLEINPSSLSEEERTEQYKSIMEKLRKISPQVSIRAAITETE